MTRSGARAMRGACALAACVAICLSCAALAAADGDPASDVLLGQDVFLPYSPISPTVEQRLFGVTAAARAHGYPIKVALIGARTDLGVVPALFGKPESYARFLSSELGGVVSAPVLVVMPAGFGFASNGRALPAHALEAIRIASGTNGLGEAAVAGTAALSAASGHPLPAGASTSEASLRASAATVAHAELAIAVMAALAAAAIGGAFALRRR